MTIGVVIPTLNAASTIGPLLNAINSEGCVTNVLVIDSASTDITAIIAKAGGAEVHVIDRSDFNHGATRELARKTINTDIVVYLTQDVVPQDGFISNLVEPILHGRAVTTYGRQLPHTGAGFLESFPRNYNYPAQNQRRCLADADHFGTFLFFSSDSFAAYSNSAMNAIGGFTPEIVSEDHVAVAKLIKDGGTIEYVANARVHHSHRYTVRQEFERYFDTGYTRGQNPWLDELAGHAEGHGVGFLRSMLITLWRDQPLLIPYALLATGAKWLGYRVGHFGPKLPRSICRALSMHKFYWNSQYYKKGGI